MTTIVYTTGYQGQKLELLEGFLIANDADLLDIRFKPWSPNPQYTKTALQHRFGDRYRHVVELGNRLYKTESIEFVDFEAGLRAIETSPRPVVLLCACADASTCHRTAAARLLAARGFTVTELREPATPAQPASPTQERLLCDPQPTTRSRPNNQHNSGSQNPPRSSLAPSSSSA